MASLRRRFEEVPPAPPATRSGQAKDIVDEVEEPQVGTSFKLFGIDVEIDPEKWTKLREPFTSQDHILIGLLLAILHAVLVSIVYKFVPNPYMDEIFHVKQTRKYCRGDYSWDPMITTPPALYVLAMPLCGGYERYVNSLLMLIGYVGFCRLRSRVSYNIHSAVLPCILLPVLLHSSVLFYTDLLGVVAVVWAMAIVNPSISALIFLLSCLVRQTNIVYAGAYAAVLVLYNFKPKNPVRSLIEGVFKVYPFVLLAIAFMVFVVFNGGNVVLGDPSAHQPKLHWAQVLYLLAFTVAHMMAHFYYIPETLRKFVGPLGIVLTAVATAFMKFGTFDHPYLLADNRHVTFYIWKRLLANESRRFLLAPIYAISALYVHISTKNLPFIVKLMLAAASVLALVPAHLIEFRYFIVPYVLYRLLCETRFSTLFTALDILINFVVFSIVFYLFLYWPIYWENEPGVVQRFMW